MNTYVNTISMKETIEEVEKIIEKGVPTQHVVINASKINLMEYDERLRRIVNECPLINADGASILLAAKILKIPVKERVTGIDLFQNLVDVAEKKQYKIYLFGAKEEVVLKVKGILIERYPLLKIVGYDNGYFDEDSQEDMLIRMRDSNADIMFVAFSSPKKEYWVHENLNKIKIPFVMGVGGSFDVIANVTKRAPNWMQNIGMEWFYRFIQEPRRMWKRYIFGNISFLFKVLKYRIK